MSWRTDGCATWNTDDGYGLVDWPFDIHTHGWPIDGRDKVMTTDSIPRRSRIDLYCPAEAAIRAALLEVEKMGCDRRLTDAVTLLGEAQARVADFVDGVGEG